MTAEGELDELCVNTIRTLAMDAVQKAGNGHPGTPMGTAAMAYALWTRVLRHNPANPAWADRDRFVLSAGHASLLLYSLLHLTGYDLSLDDIKSFRQWESLTPGHPEYRHTPGVEATTGPLGQGFGMAVGMAITERLLSSRFNRPGHDIVDHFTYGLASDGDLMEGVSNEAASLAGMLGLGRLIFLYDDNGITIDGGTSLAFTENVGERFSAQGWHVQRVDGNAVDEVTQALEEARSVADRPSLIIARTTIAYGSPNKAGTSAAHGAALGEEEVLLTKKALGWPAEPAFLVPDQALSEFREAVARGRAWEEDWQRRMDAYRSEYPEDARDLEAALRGDLPADWSSEIPSFEPDDGPMATRVASGKVINALAKKLPRLVGGSADLASSNNTDIKDAGDMDAQNPGAGNMRFGVREHAMGTIVNGMALHAGVIPFGATFLIFSDYMRPAIRLAALMNIHSLFVTTHDSIGLGEDGPTHQPVEHLASLRAIPNLTLLRPADPNETAEAWRQMIERPGPSILVLTRQNVPVLTDREQAKGAARGAYILREPEDERPALILLATGSEVAPAVAAAELLAKEGLQARVVSMPSWELFEEQSAEYRATVLPAEIKARVSIEAAAGLGWERYVGDGGSVISLDHFGASAPGSLLLNRFGFSAEAIAERAREVAKKAADIPTPA